MAIPTSSTNQPIIPSSNTETSAPKENPSIQRAYTLIRELHETLKQPTAPLKGTFSRLSTQESSQAIKKILDCLEQVPACKKRNTLRTITEDLAKALQTQDNTTDSKIQETQQKNVALLLEKLHKKIPIQQQPIDSVHMLEPKETTFTTEQTKLMEKFKLAITLRDYVDANYISSSSQLSPSMALELLHHLAATNQMIRKHSITTGASPFTTRNDICIVTNLIKKSNETPENIALTLAKKNILQPHIKTFISDFFSEIVPTLHPRRGLPLVHQIATLFFQNNKETEAQELYTFLSTQLPSKFNKPTVPVGTYAKYASNYAYWFLFQYSKDARFAAIPKADFKTFTENLLKNKLLSKLLAGTSIAEIKKTIYGDQPSSVTLEEAIPWVLSHKLPIQWAKNLEYVEFLKNTKIPSMVTLYNHASLLRQEPGILVEGKWTSFSDIMSRFRTEESRSETLLIEKATGKRWYYLERGLVPHDPANEICPFIKEAPSKNFSITFNFMNEGHLDSPSGISRFSRHSWIQLKHRNGDVYSVGHLAPGIIRSPDLFEYVHGKKKKISFNLSETDFNQILSEISHSQKEDQNLFNFLTNNCSSFTSKIARLLPLSLSQQINAKVSPSQYDTKMNRIKFYVISSEITKAIFAAQGLTNISPDSPQDVTKIIKTVVGKGFPNIDEALVTYFVSEIWEQEKDIATALIKEIYECIEQGNQAKLTNLLYNLIIDTFTAVENLEIDMPPALAERLAQLPGATKVEFQT